MRCRDGDTANVAVGIYLSELLGPHSSMMSCILVRNLGLKE